MKALVMFTGLFLFIKAFCVAQDTEDKCGCNTALIKDKVVSSNSLSQTISLFENLSRDEYETLSKDADASVKFLGIGANGSYEEFKERISKLKLTLNYNSSLNSNNQFSNYSTNPVAYKYWSDCKTSCNATLSPFVTWKSQEDENQVTVKLRYNHPAQGPEALKVLLTIEQNGRKTTKTVRILPSSNFPYIIRRLYDDQGKSSVTVKAQPVLNNGTALYDGGTIYSNYFNPALVITSVSLEYSDVITKPNYATGQLSAPDNENKRCNGIIGGLCSKSPAMHSCNGDFFALPCLAQFKADEGYYFTEPASIGPVMFTAIAGPGKDWNSANFCKEKNTEFRQATSKYIEILFMGSASKATTWQVVRPETMDIRPSQPVTFNYASKNAVNFSVPLNKLQDYTITITTLNNGNFIISKLNEASYTFGDSNGYRNFQLDLKKLKDPSRAYEQLNIISMQKSVIQKK